MRTIRAGLLLIILSLLLSGCSGGQPGSSRPVGPSLLQPDDIQLSAAEREELELGLRPPAEFSKLLAAPAEVIDGQTLNPKIQFMLSRARTAPAPDLAQMLERFDSEEKRARIRADTDRRWTLRTALSPEMAKVEDLQLPARGGALPARVYHPANLGSEPAPVLLYFHGGGFVFASIAAVDRMLRLIANEARVIVVSVDYRLAPEHPFPAPQDDAEDAFIWLRAHAAQLGGDPQLLGVGGDSAGGQLALSVALRQRAAAQPMPLQLLLYYPAVTLEQDDRSYALFVNGYGLEQGFVDAVSQLAFPRPQDRIVAHAWALREADLRCMPASIVVTAGFDPLRDQARRLATRLEADGVAVTYLNYPTLTHSFLNWSGLIEDAAFAARQTAQLFGTTIRSRVAVATPCAVHSSP